MRVAAWVALGAVGVALLTGASVARHWRSHPTAFVPAGGWGTSHDAFRAGRTLYVGMTYEAREAEGVVTLTGLAPRLTDDSSGTIVEFFVCEVDSSAGIGAIGNVYGRGIGEQCTSLVPAEGARLRLNADPKQQVVMAVSPQRPGGVTVDGIDITYVHGWQHGSQRVGGEVRLRTVGVRSPGA